LAIDAGKVVATLTLDTSQFSSGVATAKGILKALTDKGASASDKIKAVSGALTSVGKVLTLGVTAPIIAAGTASAMLSAKLDTSARKVETIADASVLSLSQIKDQARELGARMGVMPEQLTEALYNTISATNDTKSAMETVEIATKAAVGGFTDATTAVDGLTTVTNAYGLSGAEAVRKISDQMLVAQNYGKTTFGEIASGIGNVIPLAAQLKVGTNELFGAIAALTRQGIGTSESITGLKAAFSNIIKPTAEAQKMAKALGLEFSASALESRGLAGFLQDVSEKTGGSTEKMSLLFGSVEALNAVLALTGADGAKYFAGALDAMAGAAGATEAAFETMTSGAQGALDRVKVQLSNVATSFGDILLPYVEQGLSWISEQLTAFQALPESLREGVVSIAAFAAAAGPLLLIGGKLVTAFGALAGILSNPIGMGIAVVAGLATGMELLARNADSLDNSLNRAFARVNKERVEEISTKINENVENKITVSTTITPSETVTAQVESFYKTIKDKLASGGTVSEADAASVNESVNAYVDELTQGVDISTNASLAQLKRDLDSGLIDEETYKSRCEALIEQADASKTALENLRGASEGYVSELASQTGADVDGVKTKLSEMATLMGDAVKTANGMGLALKVNSVFKAVVTALTDGKEDSKTVLDGLKGDLEKLITPAIDEIETWINEQISRLDVNSADYDTQVENIKKQGASMTEELKALNESAVQWIDAMAGKSAKAVSARIGELDAIEKRVAEVMALIDAATGKAQTTDVRLVRSGATRDVDTIASALGGTYADYKTKKQSAKELAASKIAELKDRYDKGELTDAGYAEEEKKIAAELQETTNALVEEYRANIGELMKGVAEAFPELTEGISQATKDMDLADTAQGLIDKINTGTVEKSDISEELAKSLGMTPEDLYKGISQ